MVISYAENTKSKSMYTRLHPAYLSMSATVWNCFPESPTATTLLTSWPGAGGKADLGCGGRRYLGGSGLAVWILCTDDPCFDIALV